MGFTAVNVKKSANSTNSEQSSSSPSPPSVSPVLPDRPTEEANTTPPSSSASHRQPKHSHSSSSRHGSDPFRRPITPSSAATMLSSKYRGRLKVPPSSDEQETSKAVFSPEPTPIPHSPRQQQQEQTQPQPHQPLPIDAHPSLVAPQSSSSFTPVPAPSKPMKRKYERRNIKTGISGTTAAVPLAATTAAASTAKNIRKTAAALSANAPIPSRGNSHNTLKDNNPSFNSQSQTQQQGIHTHYLYPQLRSRANPPLDLTNVIKPASFTESVPKENRIFGIEEAPVFYPTQAEFADPLAYLSKISSIGKKYGMIKIVPPNTWTPAFSLDTEVRILYLPSIFF